MVLGGLWAARFLSFVVIGGGLGRLAVPAEELCDGHELIAFLFQLLHSPDRAVHGGTVQVVQQDDSTVLGLIQDRIVDLGCIAGSPVLGAGRPENMGHRNAIQNTVIEGTAGSTPDGKLLAGQILQNLIGLLKLRRDLRTGALSLIIMVPGMISQLMSLLCHTLNGGLIGIHPIAHHKEGDFGIGGFQIVQETGGMGAGAIVEGQCYLLGTGYLDLAAGGDAGIDTGHRDGDGALFVTGDYTFLCDTDGTGIAALPLEGIIGGEAQRADKMQGASCNGAGP